MVESSIPTFESFCEHHDGASLSADQEYLLQYEEIVRIYASFASTRTFQGKAVVSAPVAMRWRSAGLQAIKSVASSEALASLAGRQLDVVVPILLENMWTDSGEFLDTLTSRARLEEKVDSERLLRRRTSIATVRTAETSTENPLALSGSTADADKLAEEDIGVLAVQCLKHIFVVNNRSQIHSATTAVLRFVKDRVSQNERVIEEDRGGYTGRGWATKIYEMIARWTPVQDRYVILVTAMDALVRSPLTEGNLRQQLVLATMVDFLLKSDVNLIGLSVMDVLLGLIQHVLRVLQLDGASPHYQQSNGTGEVKYDSGSPSPNTSVLGGLEVSEKPTDLRRLLLLRLQDCIGSLATHVYYADQISDMVSALLLRLKPSPSAGIPNAAAAIENPSAASTAVTAVIDLIEDPATDGFFSFETAKVKALEAVKAILLVASHRKNMTGGSLGRNRVSIRVWESTEWLLRDSAGSVRKAYVDALLTWLEREVNKSELQVHDEKIKTTTKASRDDAAVNLSKRAASNSSHRDKGSKTPRTTFLQLLHLASYENALQYVDFESDVVLLHLLLTSLSEKLGVNSVKYGLPMIFRLQEDIMDIESPIAKIRIGSLCHGYFWAVTEKFDIDTSPIGRVIQNEIYRRKKKAFWVDRINVPPLPVANIGVPGQSTPQQALPLERLETESLLPFDDRFQMVKLISLSYSESITTPPPSAPNSPGRSFSHPILSSDGAADEDRSLPEAIKEAMMSEWTRESVLANVQSSSKTVSLNGSRSGTNTTGNRNFLAVNGKSGNSGSATPQHHPHSHRSRPNSTFGLVGGLGALTKIRKGDGHSPSPASESSRNSVTRVDALKRVLSGQTGLPGTKEVAHSDASSESMVSYDFTASEVSFNPPGQQASAPLERSVSLREPNDRSRSKSRDRASPDERARPLTSHPVLAKGQEKEDFDMVPPVPPLPVSVTGDSTSTRDYAPKASLRKGRSVRKTATDKPVSNWGEEGPVVDLQSLLNGISTGEEAGVSGNVVKPPY